MKISGKILAIILSVLTLMSVFSVATPVVAADLQSVNAEELVPADEDKITEELFSEEVSESSDNELTVIGEDESRRTADTKHFIMSDGSRKAVIYGNAVHYADSNGKWQEIDNTLTYDSEKKEYRNKNNSFKATFKEDFNEENLFTLENEGYTISWEYEANVLRKAITKTEYKNKEKPDDKVMQYAAQSEDKIKYKNFESDCELEYVVTDNGVKENIILNSKTNKNEFTFKVTAEGLTLIKNQDGSISAKNAEGEDIFFIPAPFMYDSNDVYSYDVSYEIEEQNGTYTITVVADKDWLKEDARIYPVVIDPVIYTKQTSTSVSSTFVTSALPTANYGSRQDIYVGHESANYGKCYAMFKNTLPTLNKGDMVVGAYLNLYLYNTSFDGGSSQRQLDAHIITSSWTENSVTWNTKPTYNSIITDYCFMNNGEAAWKSLDITKAVKGWYEGSFTNHGILIKEHDESLTPARGIFRSENATSITEGIPYIAIDYRNNKGTESYWSYSGFSAGIAGIANVNDYSGNLVYSVPLVSSVSEIMPVALNLVYNSYSSSQIYTAGKNSSNITSAGRGWKLNVQQTLLPSSEYGLTGEAASNYPYVYTDGDGTEHYIAKIIEDDGTIVYKDEDGLGYTFTHPGTSIAEYKLTQDDGSFMYFNAKGNLIKIYNSYSIPIQLQYDSTGTKLQKIIDGSNHTYTIKYYRNVADTGDSNYIETITDNAGRTIKLSISGKILNGITFYDTDDKAYFRYTTGVNGDDSNLLDYTWSTDGKGLAFQYLSKAKGSRVSQVTEFASDTLAGAAASARIIGTIVTFDRSLYNTTIIRAAGVDGVHNITNSGNGSDDIITTLQFDNLGRTLSQQVKFGSGESVGAGSYSYTDSDEVESRNKITSAATLNKNTVNLLNNNSFETTSNWYFSSGGGVTATHSYTTENTYYGSKAVSLTNSNVTSAYKNYVFQSINNPTIGQKYTFSAYVKVESLEVQNNLSTKSGAYVRIIALGETDNILADSYSAVIKTDTNSGINNGWRRVYVTMQIPEGTKYINVYATLDSASGTMYVDGAQLEVGTTPTSVNLLQNSGFEKYSATGINNWTPSSGVTYTQGTTGNSTDNNKEGSASLKITGTADKSIGFSQYVNVGPNENDTYIISGWATAHSVPLTHHSVGKFEIAVRVTYSCSDGTTVTQYKDSAIFNPTISRWQYAASAFSLKYEKSDTADTKTYTPTKIMVMPRFNRQPNYAYFDHIQLIKDVAQTYVYDDEGNATTVTANAEQKSDMTYDGDDLKTYTDAEGYTSEFSYNDKHLLVQAKTPKGIITKYTYNNQGQLISTEVVGTDGNSSSVTSQTYTNASSGISAGAYVSSITNELGKTTNYTYNMPTGAKTQVTDVKGNTTTYAYNSNYTKLLQTVSDSTKIEYTYDGNRIGSIKFGCTDDADLYEEFSFEYDSFGNVIKTKVGSTALVTNTYGTNNGLLQQTNYANNDAIRYQYNKAGIVTGIYQDNNGVSQYRKFSWDYSSNGTPREHKDGHTKLMYNYSYDSIGRLIRTDISDSQTFAYVGATEYGYDLRNNLTSIVNDIGGNNYAQYYYYSNTGIGNAANDTKDNLPTRYRVLGKYTNYTYDSLNRLTNKTVDVTTDINTAYYYNTVTIGSKTRQTNQLSCEVVNGISYHYTYDDVGNITAIKKGTGVSSTPSNYREYTYDNLYRLVTEKQYDTCQIITYEYDHLGNINSKTISTYQDSSFTGTPTVKTINYTYTDGGNDGWNYLLTSYDENGDNVIDENENISYDEIGNPLTYRGATMSWYGRQMRQFVKNGITTTMTYDADGLRSTKTVNGVKTEYQYVGDKLYYENRGNGDSFYYYYDSYGNLCAFYHHRNGTKTAYHVVTNSQGDVIAIYNWSGSTKVAEYKYDAWGNCTIVSDTSSTGIATLNPIRYRGYYYDNDLGLYYLQSRYYDSEIGRFVNSDNVTDPGAGLMGFNTFIYCGNNPVNAADPTGHWIIKDGLKWLAQKVSEKVTKIKEKCSTNRGTYQIGGVGAISEGVEITKSKGIAIDLRGNIGITESKGGGVGFTNVSGSVYKTVTNAPDITCLKGESAQIGGSVSVEGLSVGGEVTVFENPYSENNELLFGGTVSVGAGPNPYEAHAEITTTTVEYVNIFDEINKICYRIMEW